MGAGSSGRGWPRWNRVGKREEGETDSEEAAYVGDVVVVGDAEGRRSGEEDYENSDPSLGSAPLAARTAEISRVASMSC